MKKQFVVHLDALIVGLLVAVLAVGFIGFQRYQYTDLLEEHAQLQWKAQDLEVNLDLLQAKLKWCEKENEAPPAEQAE